MTGKEKGKGNGKESYKKGKEKREKEERMMGRHNGGERAIGREGRVRVRTKAGRLDGEGECRKGRK